MRLAIGLAIALVVVELVARFYIGLGDPPLLMSDPQLEYLYQPNQTCRRFHNLIHYNAYSMRSDDFALRKRSPEELRVIVVGDSVVNGGAQTDQSELATSILARELTGELARPVVVGNVSAGSWGPDNELAYLQRYGMFDADVLVIVVSSHDYADVATFEPLVGVVRDMPDRKPLTATGELWTRYVWPWLQWKLALAARPVKPAATSGDAPPAPDAVARPEAIARSVGALREMIRLARRAGVRVIVAQHLAESEQTGGVQPGHDVLRDAAAEEGVERIVQLGPAFAESLKNGGKPYRDSIHPNAAGQRLIAAEVKPAILDVVRSRAAATRPDQ
jgi:lysophospholipase L1-like esterase